ncbi:MAG TPA: hypothetical protein PKC39_02975 [Ferruginibacter sp.]|nr:hypothetical protein [Ferruginibacter sp.]HMP19901.1 hypothetical protein [Ferruginibacter sp.]
MLHKKKPEVDIVLDILRQLLEAYPESTFVQSLLHQYQERGGLSRKQLEGLRAKATKVKNIPPARLATLDAIILKRPVKDRSPKPSTIETAPANEARVGGMIDAILSKYPQHKRVLFYQTRYKSNHSISATEKNEIEKFYKLLVQNS